MKRIIRPGLVGIFLFALFLRGAIWGAEPAAHAAPLAQAPRPMPRVIARGTQETSSLRLPLSAAQRAARAPTATINVVYLASGAHNIFGDTCLAWPTAAKTAFSYAASIWAAQIPSSVPITIRACWTGLGSNILGYSSATSFHHDFTGGVAGYWYYSALANALAQTDLNDADWIDWDNDGLDTDADIDIAISNGIAWYYGTDGAVPARQYDLATIALHEIAHGLGFLGWVDYSGGQGSWGFGTGMPGIYDRFVENGAGQKILNSNVFPNPSAALGAQLVSTNLYFNGTNARAANSGNRAKLFAPSTWQAGSSYSHLDETFSNTADALLTFSFGYQEVIHTPGAVTLGILKDLGWTAPTSACYTLNLNASPSAGGKVSASPAPNCEGTKYLPQTNITLTATPNSGYNFYTWSGTVSSRAPTESLTMDANKEITAVFNSSSTQFLFVPMVRR